MNERPAASRSRFVLVCVALAAFAVAVPATAKEPPKKPRAASDGKVTICHRTHGKKGQKLVTIRVSARAVPAHVKNHGDFPGPCPTDEPESTAKFDRSGKTKGGDQTEPGARGDAAKGKAEAKAESKSSGGRVESEPSPRGNEPHAENGTAASDTHDRGAGVEHGSQPSNQGNGHADNGNHGEKTDNGNPGGRK